ncbi:MAG: sigma-54 dependent transcriptional regulator [Deltaproteobacteria bacterium]|nr:sigma-54 dependent transcriptional regulator [Deltaproteobacteria bacterium]
MGNETILVVDDSPAVLNGIAEILQSNGYTVDTAPDGAIAIDKINDKFYDIILTDLAMPKKDGMELLKDITENSPESMCIIITGYGTIKNAVEAIRLGAFDYLTKPVKSEEIRVVIERALNYRDLKRENTTLKKQLTTRYAYENIIGDSEKICEVFRLIDKVAQTDSTVLIMGESGTGKELIAHAIHYQSDRRDKPFIMVNCGAIPEELLESELFGHEKGAFTHAIRTRIGRFELAHSGTIFLDEIGDMRPNLQVKILRILQGHQFERIGGTKTIKTDIRVIAATNKNLEEAVKTGQFREDLYYRLNVIPIHVPPLRERAGDIPLLVHHFLEKFNKSKKKNIKSISKEVTQCFMSYAWPGNVRELENMIERLIILANDDKITIRDLPERLLAHRKKDTAQPQQHNALPEEGLYLHAVVNEFEKNLILQALDRAGWVKNKAAQLLNLNRTTLIEKMKKQKLMKPANPMDN